MPPAIPSPTLYLTPEPLTPESFAAFGTAIVSPLPRDLTNPENPPSARPHHPAPVLANQSTALKYSPISPLLDQYTNVCPSGRAAAARMSMFACFPRKLRTDKEDEVFDVRILERHPFTTQTFIPIDLSSQDSAGGAEEPVFLVIVAPSLKGQEVTATVSTNGKSERVIVKDPPDLKNMRAFVARGGQAVTYGAGTWHAPMAVLGRRRVDFVVVQFANGVDDEDCQEVEFGEGAVVRGLKRKMLAKL